MTEHRVAIVGAGLAGLNAARRLAAEGLAVTVFEAESEVGGRVRTERTDGFTLDRGFQVLFTAYPAVESALDTDSLDLRAFPPGALICRRNHRSVITDPIRDPMRAIESAFSRDLTLGDKIRTLALRRRLRRTGVEEIFEGPDDSIESFLLDAGFSRRYLESFAAPFWGGITLDRSLSTSKRVFEFTFKMLSEGRAVVPAAGMGEIPSQLATRAREAGATIETGTRVSSISNTGRIELERQGETVTADAVVVAADPETAHSLTGIDAIPQTGRGTVTQYFSLPAGNPIGDQPRIHLNAGGSEPNQVVALSAVAPAYAPRDTILLSASTPGHLDIDESELARQTRVTLASWYPEASFEALSLIRTVDVPFAQFDQPPGIHEELPAVTAPEGAVYLAGDYTEDSSINGALTSGRRAAEAILDGLAD